MTINTPFWDFWVERVILPAVVAVAVVLVVSCVKGR